MTGIRRGLILLGLTVAVIVGASLPASATYADVGRGQTTISTTDGRRPRRTWSASSPAAGRRPCRPPGPQSTTARVSGYLRHRLLQRRLRPDSSVGTATSWSSHDRPTTTATRPVRGHHRDRYGWSKDRPARTPSQC